MPCYIETRDQNNINNKNAKRAKKKRYSGHEDRVILFKDGAEKCRQCSKLQQELARTEAEMVNILTEVQQARKSSKLIESLKSQLAKAEADLERSEIQLEQTVSELRSAKISQNEAGQLKDVYRKKCEAYLRQRKDIEEQINEGSLEGVVRVMKEPLTLDDAALGPESETREELVWRLQSYEEQIKQLSEENMELRKRAGSPSKERKETKEEEELSLEQQLSDKAVINTEVSRAADSGVMDTDTASSLSEALQDCSSVRDVIKTLFNHGSAQVDKKMKERELQLERQNTKVEHLKSQIDVMALTLAESKGYADKLSMLVGQYDAGNSALNLALKYTEMALEVSEVLNLLSDSEQNVLLANCNKAGPDAKLASGTGKVTIERKRAMNNRRQVEMRAKSLLQKLEKTLEDPSGVWETMSNSTHTSRQSNGASSVGSQNSAAAEIEISQSEILRFKDYKEQLKGHKNALKATILDLDTSILQPDSEAPKTNSKTDLRLDLEHAVMLQELNCAKEERAEMKAMAYLAQQELRTLELRLEAAKLQEQGFKTQMSYYKTEWREELRKRRRLAKEVKARNSGEPNPEEFTLEMELSEALKREKKLKLKMAELTETIERLSRNAEMRHTQQGTFIGDLKRTNEALTSAYDKSKKKHALSLKKLEAQITQLVAQHERDITARQMTSHSEDPSKHDELTNNRLSYFEERSCSSFGSHGHGEETEL
ncbi:hypothetical protein ACHWQZ_G010994 [Mnemiopsis leidyi]